MRPCPATEVQLRLGLGNGQGRVQRPAQQVEIAVAFDATEAVFGFQHPGRGPALDHLAAAPALDVAVDVADHRDHGLDRVGGAQGALEAGC